MISTDRTIISRTSQPLSRKQGPTSPTVRIDCLGVSCMKIIRIDDQQLGKHDDRIDKLERELANLKRSYDGHFEEVDEKLGKIPDIYL